MSMADRKRDALFAAIANGPQLMGILNVTPDSFADGGRYLSLDASLAQARHLVAEGAAMVDLGAESTRPGHRPIDEALELARLAPILAPLVEAIDVAVSIDTTKASVAAAAIAAGAALVNDQWGLQGDPAMADAAVGVGVVMMHNRAEIDAEADVIDMMCRFFERSLAIADRAGISRAHIILDPGIGFGKSKAQNLRALGAGVASLRRTFGLPVLVGASRKSLFAALVGATRPEDRLAATLGAHLAAFAHGAGVFRVHDCREHRDALAVLQAIEAATAHE